MILVICIHTRSETNWKTSFVYQKKGEFTANGIFFFLTQPLRSTVPLSLSFFSLLVFFSYSGKFHILSDAVIVMSSSNAYLVFLFQVILLAVQFVCVVWRIEWLECVYDAIRCSPIQSNRINQTCLKISLCFFILISRISLMLLLHHFSFGSRRSCS